MSKKLTPWFHKQNPVHIGVYEVSCHHGERRFQFWDGHEFRCRAETPEEAFEGRQWESFFPTAVWRGLTEAA